MTKGKQPIFKRNRIYSSDLMFNWYSGSGLDNDERYLNFSGSLSELPCSNDFEFTLNDDGIELIQPLDIFESVDSFVSYIRKYYVHGNQVVTNLDHLYRKLCDLEFSDRWHVKELILHTTHNKLTDQNYFLNKWEQILFNFIQETVKVETGHPTELWFAIMYNGKICGGIHENQDIESDVVIGDQHISLKFRKKPSSLNFGSLDPGFIVYFRRFIVLTSIISGIELNKSYGRSKTNDILEYLDKSDIEKTLKLVRSKDSAKIDIIDRYLSEIEELIESESTILETFCRKVDAALGKKMFSVDWWCLMIRDQIMIASSEKMYELLRTDSDRLNDNIDNFMTFNLWVKPSKFLEHDA